MTSEATSTDPATETSGAGFLQPPAGMTAADFMDVIAGIAKDMAFTLDQPLHAGPQTVALTNAGEQPHFLGLAGVPAGTTVHDEVQLSETYLSPKAPPPANLSCDDLEPVFGSAELSSGMTNWFSVDLTPGDYLLVCFVPDQTTGVPHAMLGMIQIVTVE